jgi:hypothetical protein
MPQVGGFMGVEDSRQHEGEQYIPGEPEEVRRLRERLLGRQSDGRRSEKAVGASRASSVSAHQKAVGAYRGHAKFVEKLQNLVERRRSSFRSHFSVYLGVNGGLMLLNLFTSPMFPWFLFPAGGWGIGLVNHYSSYRRQRHVLREARELPPLGEEALSVYKKMKKKENAHKAQVTSFTAVGGFLAMVNMITSPAVPWFVIPCGVFAAVTFGSREGSRRKVKELRSRFEELRERDGGAGRFSDYSSEESAGVVSEAAQLKASILSQTQKMDGNPFSENIEGVLDTYVEQIKLLTYQTEEIEGIIKTIPMQELERDAEQLRKRRDSAGSEKLRREYESSLEEIERQKEAHRELEERREMLDLRVRSAINALKRMNLDLARMKSVTESGGTGLEDIKRKSDELSRYIGDLEDGYEELNRSRSGDPYGE